MPIEAKMGVFWCCIFQWIKCAQRSFYGVLHGAKFCVKNEDIHQLLSNGVQFPKAMADDILAKHSIPQDEVESNADIDMISSRRERKRYKIDAGDRANPTSLATNGDAGTQSQLFLTTRAFNVEDTSLQLTVKPVPASVRVR